jgi:hypothetical protein
MQTKELLKVFLKTQCRVTIGLFKVCIHINWRAVTFELFQKHLFTISGAAKAREDN